MHRKFLLLFLFLAALLTLSTGCSRHEYSGTVLEPPKQIIDFTIKQADGSDFTLSDYQGKLVVVYFGYTFCPDVCPATLFQLQKTMENLGSDASQVQVVMVTVDPKRDTPEQIQGYVTHFNESFIGLSPEKDVELEQLAFQFGVFYEYEDTSEESATEYLVTHTATLFLLDRESRLREIIPFGVSAEEITADIQQGLKDW